jgi:hypothetical protein
MTVLDQLREAVAEGVSVCEPSIALVFTSTPPHRRSPFSIAELVHKMNLLFGVLLRRPIFSPVDDGDGLQVIIRCNLRRWQGGAVVDHPRTT